MSDTKGAKITAPRLAAMKARGERIVCVTAYDATFGAIADEAGVDVVLVGDSLGNVILGYQTTVPVTRADMIHHTKATRVGVSRALLVADLPFGTYQASLSQAVTNAVALMQAGADAVKLEGDHPEAIRAIGKTGIPVMGHVGFTPQSVNAFGGFLVQGKGDRADIVQQAAISIAEAGAFGIVLELIPSPLAQSISSELKIPTIGIGAGKGCDGQVQVLHDLLGLTKSKFRHAYRVSEGWQISQSAIESYAKAVRTGEFPDEEHSF
jgi:3-methyl-2-oxobutanoate hydroxymethyltransferase